MLEFKTIMLTIVAIALIFLLISLTSNFWFFYKENKIKGSKDWIVSKILSEAYKCYSSNLGKKESIICSVLEINSQEDILADDITSKLDTSKISLDNFFAEDLPAKSKVIIRFENGKIFIEAEKHERVGS